MKEDPLSIWNFAETKPQPMQDDEKMQKKEKKATPKMENWMMWTRVTALVNCRTGRKEEG